MNIINGNPNLYYVDEEVVQGDKLHIELYPVIAFEIDDNYEQKIIALNIGEVKGTIFDSNLNMFISSNGVRTPPREYLEDYRREGLKVFISQQSQEFIGLIYPESESPTKVTIVDSEGNKLAGALGVEVYVSGGSLG